MRKDLWVVAGVVTVVAIVTAFAVQVQPVGGGAAAIGNPSPCQVACGVAFRDNVNVCHEAWISDLAATHNSATVCESAAGDDVAGNAGCMQTENRGFNQDNRTHSSCVQAASTTMAVCVFACKSAS